MNLKIQKPFLFELFKKVNFTSLKKIFFLVTITYFFIYFFNNYGQISFNINFQKNLSYIFFSFLFCVFSIYFNAFAWKNILIWFGQINRKKNLISFYLLSNILKYVPGGIWHFYERFNFIKDISNAQLAFYSILIEPYFMLCASFLLASIGLIFSPFLVLLVTPLIFLNKKLIYFVLRRLESFKFKVSKALKITSLNYKLEEKIKLTSFFPVKAFILELGFILSKFISFLFCNYIVSSTNYSNDLSLLVIFCLSWSIGLIIPTAPGGVGVFEASFLFLVGNKIPQNEIFVTLIYFRLITTLTDLLLSFPFLIRKLLKKN